MAATGINARIVQQPTPDVLTQARLRMRIGSQSALLQQSCPGGNVGITIELTEAAIYHLPGDGAGINRVAVDTASAFRVRPAAPSTPREGGTLGAGVRLVGALLPELDQEYVTTELFNAAHAQWNPPTPNLFTPRLVPEGAVVSSAAMLAEIVLECTHWLNSTRPDGTVSVRGIAPPIIVARGFPVDEILFTAQPPASTSVLATGYVQLGAETVAPVSTATTWQRQNSATAPWIDVPVQPHPVPLTGLFSSSSAATSALVGVAVASDNGALFRARVCGVFPPAGQQRCVFSRVAALHVSSNFPAPRFTSQPVGRDYNVGQALDISATYTGLPQPTLVQWQTRMSDGEPWANVDPTRYRNVIVPGFINYFAFVENGLDRLTGLQPLTTADRGRQFRATYTTVAGTATSLSASINVTTGQPAPQFVTQPLDTTVASGSPVLFAASAGGAVPLSYQWFFNGQRIVGANAPLLTLNAVNTANAGTYALEVSNVEATVRSNTVRLTVTGAGMVPSTGPTITAQPASLTVPSSSSAGFTVAVAGAPSAAYQWRRNGVDITGATQATYSIAIVTVADAGAYSVLVTNGGASTTSAVASLNVNSNPSPVLVAPTIATQPTGLAVNPSQTATLAVAASGSGPLAYQWQRNGAVVPGASGPVLTVASAQLADAGTYTVTVSNAAGSITSAGAGLVVVPPAGAPAITSQPGSRTVTAGQSATFNAAVSGNPAPQCLWTRDGVAIASATSCASYTTPATAAGDDGAIYNLVAYGPGGVAIGNGALLTVTPAPAVPVITQDLADVSAPEGGTATFSVAATASGPLFYYWVRIGDPTAPLGGSSYSFGPLQVSDHGATVRVIVCNGPLANGVCTASRDATLTVTPAIPANALTATQVVAGTEWSLALRPDRTVWGWGALHRSDGTVQLANLTTANQAMRPVRMYAAALSDVRAISGWANSFWALRGEPGSTGSRVLHWGAAHAGSDGRGGDGNGTLGSSIPTRYNEAAPVEVLERVGNLPRPVDRVCAIAGGGEQLAMIRAISSAGFTTDCRAGSAKTVWFVGALTARGYDSTGVAFAMPGLPTDSPPALVFAGLTTSGSPGLVITLEDGRVYGLGNSLYGGFGVAPTGSGTVGGPGGPLLLPATWGGPRSLGMSFYTSLFVVRSDGSVMTSGYDSNGELGLGSVIGGSTLGPVPVQAESCTALPCADVLTGVSAIVGTATNATLALKNGQILGWGARDSAGLRGPGVIANQPFPRVVPSTVVGFTALSASNAHALVIGPGNVVYAWGSGLRAALGDGVDGGTRTEPGMVTTP